MGFAFCTSKCLWNYDTIVVFMTNKIIYVREIESTTSQDAATHFSRTAIRRPWKVELSPAEREETITMEELVHILQDLVTAVDSPSWWDKASIFSSFVPSIVAIGISIYIPRRIANRQDKIALFEKRFNIYSIIQGFYLSCENALESLTPKGPYKTSDEYRQSIYAIFPFTILVDNAYLEELSICDVINCFDHRDTYTLFLRKKKRNEIISSAMPVFIC